MEDIIIRGGTVVDGTGAPGYRADVAVRDGRISAIGDLTGVEAARVLNAEGMIVSPGFIDAHSHSDTVFVLDDSCAAKLCQGVTTEVSGQCGFSAFPALPERVKENEKTEVRPEGWYFESFAKLREKFTREGFRMSTNLCQLVGHGCLRAGVIGYEDRKVTPAELEEMKRLLRRDLEDGAWGMSMGLEYSPGCFADLEELSALGAVVKEFDGLMPCHMRSEGLRQDEAIAELTAIGRASGVHVHISHIKIDNFRVHGRAPIVWQQVLDARNSGVNMTVDMYPYRASCTGFTNRCPRWSIEGGPQNVVTALHGPRRQEVIDYLRDFYFDAPHAATCLFHDDCGYWPEIVGKNLQEVAEELLHTTDYAEAAAAVLERTNGLADCIFFGMSEEDVDFFMHQDVGIGSDGYGYSADPAKVPGMPHPRSYGALVEFLRLCREKKLYPVEEAVRRITSKAADMIGLQDRGRLQVGLAADITVFDPETVAPRATFMDPIQLAQGIRHVVVNGGIALEDGVQTAYRGGKFLLKR